MITAMVVNISYILKSFCYKLYFQGTMTMTIRRTTDAQIALMRENFGTLINDDNND